MDRVRVLLVDDSKFIRMALRKVLEEVKDVEVVGEARDGEEAVRLALELKPDIITMDIVMPKMDGVRAIKEIKRHMDVPIIVISDHTTEGAKITFEALEAGAVDFISKGSAKLKFDFSKVAEELVDKLRLYTRKKSERKPFSPQALKVQETRTQSAVDIVGIGVSTGGPKVLPVLIKNMGRLPVPVVIAQHMPPTFTKGLAEWLSKETHLRVEEGYDGMKLEGELFVVIPGGKNGSLERKNESFILRVHEEPQTIVKPSADVLFKSMAEKAKSPVALILTGMGNDGTEGAKKFKEKGFTVIVQEPSTCVVCGMPCSAIEAGAYTYIMPVEEMGKKVRELCGGLRHEVCS